MKKFLTFEINCGETTCASEPGRFCCLMMYNAGNGKSFCRFFGKLFDREGWVQRHENCLENEKETRRIERLEKNA